MDLQAKKHALRSLTYGLYVVTSGIDNEVCAGTINWLSQASFSPPLVMAGVKKENRLHDIIKQSGVFVVNILGDAQKDMAEAFYRPALIENETLSGYSIKTNTTGVPILSNASSFLECTLTQIFEGGDHSVVIGEVIEAGVHSEQRPLDMRTTGWFYGG